MDHERSLVKQGVRARLSSLDGAMVVDEDEVFRLDQGEVLTLAKYQSTMARILHKNSTHEWVHPETVGPDRVLYERRGWS